MRRLFALGIVILFAMSIIPSAYALSTHSNITISGNTLTYCILSDNPVVISDETPGYTPETGTVTIKGETYDTINIVNEDNTDTGGIADSEGNVNVHFTMNDDRPFFFAINHFDGENSKLRIIITIDGVTRQYTSNISGYVTHYIGYSEKDFSLAYLISKEDWIQSTSEISVEIYNYNGHVPDNVTLSILFV